MTASAVLESSRLRNRGHEFVSVVVPKMQNAAARERRQSRGTGAVPGLRDTFAGGHFSRALPPAPDWPQRRSRGGGNRIELLLSPAKKSGGALRRLRTFPLCIVRLRIARPALLPAMPGNRETEGKDQESRERANPL